MLGQVLWHSTEWSFGSSLLNQFPAGVPGKASEDGPSSGPHALVEDPKEAVALGCVLNQGLVVLVILGVDH